MSMKVLFVIVLLMPFTTMAQYSEIEDVLGHSVNLDSIIIKYAGETGIPPQMIKGHIEKETLFENSWRYEPFEDIYIQDSPKKRVGIITNKDGTLLPFVVSEAGMGGDFPTEHTNVNPTDYQRTPLKITRFLEDHLERYINRSKMLVIGRQEYTQPLTRDLKRIYKEVLLLGFKGKDARDFAIEVMKNELHSEEYGDNYSDLYAQTRISASYGLTQMLYTTAICTKFAQTGSRYTPANSLFMKRSDVSSPPEKLNEINYLFPRYVDLMLQRLWVVLGKPASIPDHDWSIGFEEAWRRAFQMHNPFEVGYGQRVISLSQRYLPH
jgi:hypothetical protein